MDVMDEIDIFIQGAKSTVDRNKYAVNSFKRFMGDDDRKTETIPPVKLNDILCRIFMHLKK